MNDVMRVIKQFECRVYKQDLQLFCSMEVGIPKNRLTEAGNLLSHMQNVAIEAY
jgi:hypothetical protein